MLLAITAILLATTAAARVLSGVATQASALPDHRIEGNPRYGWGMTATSPHEEGAVWG
jgi:hypothetical protein